MVQNGFSYKAEYSGSSDTLNNMWRHYTAPYDGKLMHAMVNNQIKHGEFSVNFMKVMERVRTEKISPSESLKDMMIAVYHHGIYSTHTIMDHITEMGKGRCNTNTLSSTKYEVIKMVR